MVREEAGVILTMDDIPGAPEGVYNPSRKKKVAASEAHKESHKPPRKKVVSLVQKEVKEVAYYIILIPTKTRSGAFGKNPLKTTFPSVPPAPIKKLGKMILHVKEEEYEELEDNIPLVGKTKDMMKYTKDLLKEFI